MRIDLERVCELPLVGGALLRFVRRESWLVVHVQYNGVAQQDLFLLIANNLLSLLLFISFVGSLFGLDFLLLNV